ncbi:hypothetical protein CONCODRAFT_9172 [Conidiobolus coronatus NRRL 28638]|uniref:Uncharacterized protein n=1 Tax=Conidiobolus coronatus (strain ATCC 28846 / CBS 209.66 / NRRL 28638) TaxID=796925 RepID=A0A137P0K0_CONC2|nr:hypothetical protein CONCODRAFT_9172 [Conidiobolus coronatus NRRL 28638]|eukprot:KXN68575.1 hypothetical protein CONCODRAFT_9172 [Conidiobolus coronatus NRRL 28638]
MKINIQSSLNSASGGDFIPVIKSDGRPAADFDSTLEPTLPDSSQAGCNNNQGIFSKQVYYRYLTQLRYEQLTREPKRLESKLITLQRTVDDVYRTQIDLVNRLGGQLKGYKSNDHVNLTELLSSKISSKLATTSSALSDKGECLHFGRIILPRSNLYQTLLSNHYKLQPILNSPDFLAQLTRHKRWMDAIKLARYLIDQLPHFFKLKHSKFVDHLKELGQNGLNLIAKGLFTDLNFAIESYLSQKTSQAGDGLKKVKSLLQHMIGLKSFELIVTEQLISVVIIGKCQNDQRLIASNDNYLNLHLKLTQLFSEVIKSTLFGMIYQGAIAALNGKLPDINLENLNKLKQLSSIRQLYKLNHPLLLKHKTLARTFANTKVENFRSSELYLQQINTARTNKLTQIADQPTNTKPIKLIPSLKHFHNEVIAHRASRGGI